MANSVSVVRKNIHREIMMRKLLFICGIFFGTSVFATAEWIDIGTTRSNDRFFIDVNSIERSGDSVTYWVKVNNAARDADGTMSAKIQQTINCRHRQFVSRYIIAYDELDNNGRILVARETKRSWSPIPPETMIYSHSQLLCER
jgi:hypothetical protein